MHSTATPASGEPIQRLLFDDFQGSASPRSPAPAPPANSTDTSRAAAEFVAPKFSKRQQRALTHIRGCNNGATNEEVSIALAWPIQSTTPVTNALARAGLIADSGKRRKTRANVPAKVWVAT